MVQRIRDFAASLPTDVQFGQFLGSFKARDIVQAAKDFATVVQAGRELLRAQLPQARRFVGESLEGISNVGGELAVEAGLAMDLDAGIVFFHEEITKDKPNLRRILRKVDERAGRRPRQKRSIGQQIIVTGVKAGRMKRSKSGQFTAPDTVLKGLLARAQSRQKAANRKRDIERQKKFDAKLRGFKKKIVLPNIRGAKRRRS